MITRCGIYTRTAIQDQDISAALKNAERFIEAQENAWVATHYHDNGYSGANMVRPALLRLIRDIEAGKIQAVLVDDICVLTRNHADMIDLAKLMALHNVRLITLKHGGDFENPVGRLLLQILISFAEYERQLEEKGKAA